MGGVNGDIFPESFVFMFITVGFIAICDESFLVDGSVVSARLAIVVDIPSSQGTVRKTGSILVDDCFLLIANQTSSSSEGIRKGIVSHLAIMVFQKRRSLNDGVDCGESVDIDIINGRRSRVENDHSVGLNKPIELGIVGSLSESEDVLRGEIEIGILLDGLEIICSVGISVNGG